MSESNRQTAAAADEDLMLPEGWTEDEDLFASESEGPETTQQAETLPGLTPAGEENAGPDPAPEGEVPATDARPSGTKLRFTARVDHQDRDVELDESELPALYQKAQATERAQRRLRQLGGEAGRDLSYEAEELLAVFPQMRGKSIPTEVVLDSLRSDRTLTAAFADYSERQHRRALEELRRNDSRSRQNSSAAQHSPVRGVTGGGGTDTGPADPFLRGFNSEL